MVVAENLEEGSRDTLSEPLFEPLKAMAEALHLTWRRMVRDARYLSAWQSPKP
jgi:hypothetical protein